MKLQKPTIVLFDMDGTTVRHVNPKMLGALERIDDVIYAATRFIHKKEKFYDETEPPTKQRLIVHRMLHRFRRRPVEQIVKPCAGIIGLLNLLRECDIPVGIVSNGLGKGYGFDILQKFDLEKYYQSKTFREHITRSKPHPEPILRGLSRFNRSITEDDVVWYIGDRHKDVIAALEANKLSPATIVPFSYGIHAALAVLEKHLSPDHIIVNYYDFTAKIYPLLKQS